MEKITNFFEKKLGPIAMKFSNMKYIKVIINALYSTVAFVIIGSLAALIVRAPVDSTTLDQGIIKALMIGWEWLKKMLYVPFRAINQYTIGMYSVYIAAACGYHTGKMNKMNTILSSFLGIVAFLVCSSLNIDGTLSTSYFGSSGLVISMISSIAAVELLTYLYNKEIGKFDLAKYGVPPTLSDSFRLIIPISIVLVLFSLIGYGFLSTVGPLPEIITVIVSPLISVADNIWFMTIVAGCFGLFWWFGIHDGVLNSAINPVTSVMLITNIEMYAAGTDINSLPYIGSKGFFWVFLVNYGILPLAVLCLLSKSKQIKTMGKVSILPAIFSISEPLVFGLPICYNPYFLIPYILVPALNIGISYMATATGLMNKVCAFFTTTIPTPIHAFLVTTDFRAVIIVLILYVLDAVIYYPFLKAYEKDCLRTEETVESVQE